MPKEWLKLQQLTTPVTDHDGYTTTEDLLKRVEELPTTCAAAKPTVTVGATTHDNLPVHVVTFGAATRDEAGNKPRALMVFGMHGREHMSGEVRCKDRGSRITGV